VVSVAPTVNQTKTATRISLAVEKLSEGGGVGARAPIASRALRRARAGDRDALSFLYARYADEVYGRARMGVDDHQMAVDITQRVFAKLGGQPERGEDRRGEDRRGKDR
jgi:hypothetical protein